jgi:hypothetical protein
MLYVAGGLAHSKSRVAGAGSSSSSRSAVHGARPGSPQIGNSSSRGSSFRPASAPGDHEQAGKGQ